MQNYRLKNEPNLTELEVQEAFIKGAVLQLTIAKFLSIYLYSLVTTGWTGFS
jgi:hypothetical protein